MALLSFFPWLPTKEPKLVTHIVRHCQARTRKQICYFIEPVKSCTVMFFWAVLKNKKNLDCFHFLCIFTFKCDETPTISMKSYIKTSLVEQPISVFPFFDASQKLIVFFRHLIATPSTGFGKRHLAQNHPAQNNRRQAKKTLKDCSDITIFKSNHHSLKIKQN